jgi:hypothetical protein
MYTKRFLTTSIVLLQLSLLVFVAAQSVHSQSVAVPAPEDYQEIQRLEAEWNVANELSDPEAKERLLASDSYHVGPSGRHYDKAGDIAAAVAAKSQRLAGTSVKFDIVRPRIRMYAGVAVVTGDGRSTVTENGIKRSGNWFSFVHVWEKRGSVWQLTVDQVTTIAGSSPPATANNAGSMILPVRVEPVSSSVALAEAKRLPRPVGEKP